MAKRKSRKHRRFERAIADACRCADSLGAILLYIPDDDIRPDDSRVRLKRELLEYADYLHNATWWRDGEQT